MIGLRNHKHQLAAALTQGTFIKGSDGPMFVYYWEKGKRVIDCLLRSDPGIAALKGDGFIEQISVKASKDARLKQTPPSQSD